MGVASRPGRPSINWLNALTTLKRTKKIRTSVVNLLPEDDLSADTLVIHVGTSSEDGLCVTVEDFEDVYGDYIACASHTALDMIDLLGDEN